MAGLDNDVLYGDNLDFTGDASVEGQFVKKGQLLIGTGDDPAIDVNVLDTGIGIDITNGIGTIEIAVDSTVATKFTTNSGTITLVTNEVRFLEGSNITITPLGNSFTIASTASSSFTWSVVSGTSQTVVADNGYIADNAGLVTFTLPATCAIGDTFKIIGKGAGKFRIAQNAGQKIVYGNQTTTTGVTGLIDAEDAKDVVELVCTEIDIEFQIVDSIGNLTVA